MKSCKRCGSDSNGYYPQTRNKDGLRPYCKMCDKAQSRITYHKNKELLKIRKEKLKKTNMIKGERIRDYVESVLNNDDDLERVNEIVLEIKTDEPGLSEVEYMIRALDQLSFELKGAADGMFSMAKSMRRDDKLRDLGI
mgnify:CR=1 FL=1